MGASARLKSDKERFPTASRITSYRSPLDLVVKEMQPASEGADWKAAIRSSAISAHQVLERHPWACGLMMSPARVRPARLRYMDSMLGRLREAGFSAELTDRAYHALDSRIIGSTLWEVPDSAGQVGSRTTGQLSFWLFPPTNTEPPTPRVGLVCRETQDQAAERLRFGARRAVMAVRASPASRSASAPAKRTGNHGPGSFGQANGPP